MHTILIHLASHDALLDALRQHHAQWLTVPESVEVTAYPE